jgi:hypothetical protein
MKVKECDGAALEGRPELGPSVISDPLEKMELHTLPARTNNLLGT